jgi:hypothetical protein
MSTVKATRTADMLAHIHFSLGHIPENAIVIAQLKDRKMGATLRMNWTKDPDWHGYFAGLAERYLTHEADSTIVILYNAPPEIVAPALNAARRELAKADQPVGLAITVDDTHFTEVFPAGERFDLDVLNECAVTATMISHGFPLPRRGLQLEIPDPDLADEHTAQIMQDYDDEYLADILDRNDLELMAPMREKFEALLMSDGGPVEAEACEMVADFTNHHVRDRHLADIVTGPYSHDGEEMADALLGKHLGARMERFEQAERLLRYLLRYAATPENRAPLLTVLGWVKWWQGESSKADLYLDAALRTKPDYALAGLFKTMLGQGILPARLINGPLA